MYQAVSKTSRQRLAFYQIVKRQGQRFVSADQRCTIPLSVTAYAGPEQGLVPSKSSADGLLHAMT
jgi:hypothetical protein